MRFTLFGGSVDAAQRARAAAYDRTTVGDVAKAVASTTVGVVSAADKAAQKMGASAKGALESASKAVLGHPSSPMAGSDKTPYYGTGIRSTS